jgi:hypothetical protein
LLEIGSTTVRYKHISWTLAASVFQEVYVPILAKYEFNDILAHCVIVMSRVDAQVSTPAEHYLLYRTVFPRTLSIPLLATWDNIVAEHPLGAGQFNVLGFHSQVCLFIKAHVTNDDRRELVNLIHHAPKPQTMGVGPYFYHLSDLNKQVPWLPAVLLFTDRLCAQTD